MIGSSTVDFIRGFFREPDYKRVPSIPVIGYSGMSSASPYFSYGMPTGTLGGITDYLRLDTELVSRFIDYEDMDDQALVSCVAGDTVVSTLDGDFTIKELCEKYPNGEKFKIFAYDRAGKQYVVADAHHPRKTKTDRVVLVDFDDGTHLKCTYDHKILVRRLFEEENGFERKTVWVEAGSLEPGDKVVPFSIVENKSRGYFYFLNPERPKKDINRLREVHLAVGIAKYGIVPGRDRVFHHADENKKNNSWDNIVLMTRSEHARHHSDDSDLWVLGSKSRKKSLGDQRWLDKESLSFSYKNKFGPKGPRKNIDIKKALRVVRNSEFFTHAARDIGVNETTLARHLLREGYDYRKELGSEITNHKVVSVRECGIEDVYDLTTDIYHNFIANGIVVHNSSIDIYADESTQVDSQSNQTVMIDCDDGEIKRDLETLFYKTLKIEEIIWPWARTACKYGNHYAEIVAKDRVGVVALNQIPPPLMRRIELPKIYGERYEEKSKDTLGFIYDPRGMFKISTDEFINELQYKSNPNLDDRDVIKKQIDQNGAIVFESWEIVHTRLTGKNISSIYGFGIGEPARWIFKRLMLLEDSIILYRLSRAPSRFAFYVDVSGVPPNETTAYLTRVKQALKKKKFVNPNSNKLDQKFDVLSSDDDFFLPTRDGKESTRVETLTGPVYDHIEDVKFFENKLFAALKVPKPFLTYEETTAKTHLSAEDARFARTIMRVQREVRNGLKKVAKVHLAAKGINPETVTFDIRLTIPSAIFELSQLEIRNAELELADKFGAWAPKEWIMSNILGFSDEQILEMERMRLKEEGGGEEPSGGGGGSGAIEQAIAKRGQQAIQPPAESRIRNKNTQFLLERIQEERLKDKRFDARWKNLSSFMKEVQQSIRGRYG